MAHPGKYISSVVVVVVVFVVVVVLVIVVFVVGVVGSCHVHENVFYPDAPSAPDFYSCLVVCLSVCLSVCLYVCSLVVVVLCVCVSVCVCDSCAFVFMDPFACERANKTIVTNARERQSKLIIQNGKLVASPKGYCARMARQARSIAKSTTAQTRERSYRTASS